MPNSDTSPIIQPNSMQQPTMPNSDIIQPNSLPSLPMQVPSPITAIPNSLVQAEAAVPSPNITALNPQASSLSLIPQTTLNPSFAPNSNQASLLIPQTIPFTPNFTQTPTLNSDFDANPQQSLTDLMSEALYSWPNQAQFNHQGLASGDQDLFDFSGFQDLSNVRLVLQASGFIHIVI